MCYTWILVRLVDSIMDKETPVEQRFTRVISNWNSSGRKKMAMYEGAKIPKELPNGTRMSRSLRWTRVATLESANMQTRRGQFEQSQKSSEQICEEWAPRRTTLRERSECPRAEIEFACAVDTKVSRMDKLSSRDSRSQRLFNKLMIQASLLDY